MSSTVEGSQVTVVDPPEQLSGRTSDDKIVGETSTNAPAVEEKCRRDNGAQSPADSGGRADSFDEKEEFLEANTSFECNDETDNDNEKHTGGTLNDSDAVETTGSDHKEVTPLPSSDDTTVDPKPSDLTPEVPVRSEGVGPAAGHANSTAPSAESAELEADPVSAEVPVISTEKSDVSAEADDEKSDEQPKSNETEQVDELSESLKNSQLSTDHNSHSEKKDEVENEKQCQPIDVKHSENNENHTNDDDNENENDDVVIKHENKNENENDDDENEDENEDEDDIDDDDGPDDDENKTSPAYIPRGGRFYMHDLRANDGGTGGGGGSSSGCLADDESAVESAGAQAGSEAEPGSAIKAATGANASPAADPANRPRPSRADRKWEHDLYDDRLQRPKTAKELARCYGRDIRNREPADETEDQRPKLKANVPPDSNDDNESTASNFEDEDDDSETAPEFKPQTRRTRLTPKTGQRRRLNSQAGGGGVAEGRRRAAPSAGGRRQISAGGGASARVADSERRTAKRSENNYDSRYTQGSTSRPFHAHQKRVGGGPAGFGGPAGYRRTITSTRYSTAADGGGRPPAPRIPRDDYSAANEATDGTNGGDAPSPPRQYSSRGGGKRYTAQRHGNAPPVNFAAASSSASAQQTQKYTNTQPKNFAHNQSSIVSEQQQLPYHQTQQRFGTTQQPYPRGRGPPAHSHTGGGYNGNYANGRGQQQHQQQQQQQQRYPNQQYHQPHNSSGPGANYHNQPPPNFVPANSYMENYPPLGGQPAPIGYQQPPAVVYMPAAGHSNQRLRQPTDTVYYDTTKQQQQQQSQQQRGAPNNSGHTVAPTASSSGDQQREKRQLQIAEPGK